MIRNTLSRGGAAPQSRPVTRADAVIFGAMMLVALAFVFTGSLKDENVYAPVHYVELAGIAYIENIPYVDINTADTALLAELPGIGEVLAERIVEYRSQNGLFANIDDLRNVKGIGKAKLDAIRDRIVAVGTN